MKRLGFTLIELLIVIVIIGILAALLLTAVSSVKLKAHRNEMEADDWTHLEPLLD